MKKNWLLVVVFFAQYIVHSQYHEIGLFIGGANYVGDVGSSNYIYPENPALGIIYKWNRTTRYSLRANFMYTSIDKSDYNPNDFARFMRQYRFENSILEFSAGTEINFFDFNLHGSDKLFTPYLFLGVGYIKYDLFYHDPKTFENIEYAKGSNISLPIIIGLKANVSPVVILGIEIGARYTFSDNIDGSHPKSDSGVPHGNEFGNINNTVSYTHLTLPTIYSV